MENWNKSLKRENIDEFFKLYSSAAYKSAYKILGDTTRTENVLIESFIETYQRRKEIPPDRLAFSFGLVLQKKIEPLTEQFPVRESEIGTTRTLDEFTQNSMLMTIHQQIDSLSFQFLELFLFNIGAESGRENSFWSIFRSTGISILSLIQIVVVALIIYFVATISLQSSVDSTVPIPQSPRSSTISVSDQMIRILEYLPLPVASQNSISAAGNMAQNENAGIPATDTGIPADTPQQNNADTGAVTSVQAQIPQTNQEGETDTAVIN